MRRLLSLSTSCPIFLLAVLAIGCASGYSLSSDALKYRAALTDARAFDTIRQAVARTDAQAGLCSAVTNQPGYEQATLLSIVDPLLTLSSFYTVITGVNSSGNVAAGTVSTAISTDRRPGTFKIDLRQLHKIRVLTELHGYGCDWASKTPLQGFIVMIDNRGIGNVSDERPNGVAINVTANNMDQLVAALSYLSPQAKLLRGTGF